MTRLLEIFGYVRIPRAVLDMSQRQEANIRVVRLKLKDNIVDDELLKSAIDLQKKITELLRPLKRRRNDRV